MHATLQRPACHASWEGFSEAQPVRSFRGAPSPARAFCMHGVCSRPVNYRVGMFVRVPERFGFPPIVNAYGFAVPSLTREYAVPGPLLSTGYFTPDRVWVENAAGTVAQKLTSARGSPAAIPFDRTRGSGIMSTRARCPTGWPSFPPAAHSACRPVPELL